MVKRKNLLQRIFRLGETPSDMQDVRRMIVKTEPIGSPGTRSYGGWNYEDYLNKLNNTQKADLYDQMRRSDPQVSMCLSAVKNPIKAATWEIRPAENVQNAEEMAKFCEFILFRDMEKTWDDFLTEALTMLEFGFAPFEITDKIVTGHPEFGDYNGIGDLGWRSPRTIKRFNLDPQKGKLVSISQYAYGDLQRLVDIPAEHLMLFVLNKEGSNYEGISALRPVYGCWFRKEHYLKMNAIGIERFAIPTPIVEVPSGAEGTEQFNSMIAALEAYTQFHSNYLTMPKDWTTNFNTNTYDPEKVEASIDAEDKRMVKSFMANFLELGLGKGGAYSLSNDLSDFFLSSIEHVVGMIEAGINGTVIPRLIKLNYGPQASYPKLHHSGISDKAGEELSIVMKNLGEAQFIQPDAPLEDHLRRQLKLPPKDMATVRQTQQATPAAPQPDQMSLSERIQLAERRRIGKRGW